MPTTPSLHLMIATGQNLANLIPAVQCNAARAWILQTPAMRASAGHLAAALKARGVQVQRIDFDDGDVGTLHAQAEAIALQLDGRPVTINFTGGTKPMTLALTQTLAPHLATGGDATQPHLVYCDTAHQRLDWLAPAARSEPMADVLRIDDVLLAQGYRRQGGSGGAEAAERQRAAQEREAMTRWIGEHIAPLARFFGAMNALAGAALGNGGRFAPEQQLNYPPGGAAVEWLRECHAHGLAHWDGDVQVVFGSAEAARYLGGGWVEDYAALKIAGARAHDHAVSLRVQHVDSDSTNEIDACVVHRNRVLVVECKAAHPGGSDADWIYKLSQLARAIGGALATPLLLSARALPEAHKQRAREYGVDVLDGADLATLPARLRSWMAG